jgi:conserved oligomeric Golgi complex subunit 2
MAHKHAPSAPSDFVSGILKPVRVFFGIGLGAVTSTKAGDITDTSPGARLPPHFQREYAETVFERAAQRYAQNLTAMRKTEESLRRLKKGPSQAGLAHTHGRDEERTRAQMVLDVESFAREARALGVEVDSSPAFAALSNVVRAAPPV